MFCVFAFQYSWHPKIVITSRKLALKLSICLPQVSLNSRQLHASHVNARGDESYTTAK